MQCEDVGQASLTPTSGRLLFNPTLSGVDAADVILMVGTNPRVEAPVLNARIRKAQLEGVPIGMLGEDVDLTYPTTHLGGAPPLSAKKNADFSLALDQARRPLVLVGANCDPAVMAEVEELFLLMRETSEDGWNPISDLHHSASTVGPRSWLRRRAQGRPGGSCSCSCWARTRPTPEALSWSHRSSW